MVGDAKIEIASEIKARALDLWTTGRYQDEQL